MPDSMRLRLNKTRTKQLDQLREQLDNLPDDRWKADVIDAALVHLQQSIKNAEDARGKINPEAAAAFNTDVVKVRYRTSVETRRP